MNSSGQESICNFMILRDLRKREHLSIAELSEKSGVSASVISKLERNQSSAEMDTLYRIARVSGMTLSDLISLAENQTAHLVREEKYKSGDFLFRRVSYGNLRAMHAFARKGSRLSKPELHRDDYELLWILRGSLKITLPNESYQLTQGMSIQFDALLSHSYEICEDCELVIFHIRKGKRF